MKNSRWILRIQRMDNATRSYLAQTWVLFFFDSPGKQENLTKYSIIASAHCLRTHISLSKTLGTFDFNSFRAALPLATSGYVPIRPFTANPPIYHLQMFILRKGVTPREGFVAWFTHSNTHSNKTSHKNKNSDGQLPGAFHREHAVATHGPL